VISRIEQIIECSPQARQKANLRRESGFSASKIFTLSAKHPSNCFRLKRTEIELTSWRTASFRADKFWIFAPFATVFSRNQKFYA
jgi:hypothetical protein